MIGGRKTAGPMRDSRVTERVVKVNEIFSYNWIQVALLALIAVCQVAMMVTVLIAAQELRRTSLQLNRLYPRCNQLLQKSDRAIELTRQLLTRANRSMQEVEGVLHKACSTVSESVGKVQTFLSQRFGNGSRARFHRQHREQ